MDFDDFLHKYSWHNWPSNGSSSSHITQHLLLHYLRKQNKRNMHWNEQQTSTNGRLDRIKTDHGSLSSWSTSFTYLLQYFLLSNVSLVTRSCFRSTAHQRIGSWSDRTVGVRNLRLHLSGSVVKNRQNPLILLRVTIVNVGVPFYWDTV